MASGFVPRGSLFPGFRTRTLPIASFNEKTSKQTSTQAPQPMQSSKLISGVRDISYRVIRPLRGVISHWRRALAGLRH